MAKKYNNFKTELMMAAEPMTGQMENQTGLHGNLQAPSNGVSTTERIMASTMSVDAYFDELISLVHEDYANL